MRVTKVGDFIETLETKRLMLCGTYYDALLRKQVGEEGTELLTNRTAESGRHTLPIGKLRVFCDHN